MKRLLCSRLPEPGRSAELPDSEAEHALRVLRLREGDKIEALDGRGKAVISVLKLKAGKPFLEFLEVSAAGEAAPLPLTLEMSILKGDAMEWVIEKSVELGVRRLIPVMTAHTVVQVKGKGPEAFRDRWQKIADQSLKQCGRLDGMQVELPVELQSLLGSETCTPTRPRLWCDEVERSQAPQLGSWLAQHKIEAASLLIGPEGGWSALERELLERTRETIRIGLGPWVLRAETAALFGVSLVTSQFRLSSPD